MESSDLIEFLKEKLIEADDQLIKQSIANALKPIHEGLEAIRSYEGRIGNSVSESKVDTYT